MDQPSPDPASSVDPADQPAFASWRESPPPGPPGTDSDTEAAAASEASAPPPPDAAVRRLQSRIETTDPIIAWTRCWVSREMRLHGVLAARTLDFAVLTERGIFLLSAGFFTRRPRRCVYAARLDEVSVTRLPKGRGVRLRFAARKARALRLELRSGSSGAAFTDALVARTHTPPA